MYGRVTARGACWKKWSKTSSDMDDIRLDKYLWAVRVFKTRSDAADAVRTNKVTVNGAYAKPSREVKIGDVIAVRNELLPAGEREENIPCNLNDTEWFAKIDASGGAVFFASGVFYYFLTEQVKALVQKMADAFPSGVLVFDAANRTAVKIIAKTWLKSAKIKDVGAYFAVSDAKSELFLWDSRLQVTSRGYMLGYNDLHDPSVSGFFRFLARVGDGVMKMQIVRIKFGGR